MKVSPYILILLLIAGLTSCEAPEGLSEVSGVQGLIQFGAIWPDEIKSAVVVVFDTALDLDSIGVADYPVVDHFITFGDPISPGTLEAEYFIQLEPGQYITMAIGLLLEPAILLANESYFERIGEYIVVPENSAPRGVLIREKEVNEQTGWSVQF